MSKAKPHHNKYSTVYRSNDGCISSSNHFDILFAEAELEYLIEDPAVNLCLICPRNQVEYMIKTLQESKVEVSKNHNL